jgi:RNA polymerase sigma factor (sigma-70 family)
MGKVPDIGGEGAGFSAMGKLATEQGIEAWFVSEVLPLEPALVQFLHHNWRNESEIEDLLQDVYVRVCESARREIPVAARSFVFAVARHMLIDRVRHAQVVPIEAVADLDMLGVALDEPGPDRNVIARDELRQLQVALDKLAPRAREAVMLKRVEGLSRREIAQRMGIAEDTVSEYLANGMCALADTLYGMPPDPRGKS